jgi:hypothetical protein
MTSQKTTVVAKRVVGSIQSELQRRLESPCHATPVKVMQTELAYQELHDWLGMCTRIRQPQFSALIDSGRLSEATFNQIASFCTPDQLRPESVYSTVMAAAWRAALPSNISSSWYKHVHGCKESLTLPGGRFAIWRASQKACAAIASNLMWLLERYRKKSSAEQNVLQWHRMLQAAYEFQLPQLFDQITTECQTARAWTSDQLALFALIW